MSGVRGQPLVALLAVLGGWIGGRLTTWEPPVLARGAAASEHGAELAGAGQGRLVFDAVVGAQSLPGSGAVPHSNGYVAIPQAASRAARFPSARAALAPSAFRELAAHTWGPSARMFAPPSADRRDTFAMNASRREPGLSDYPWLPPISVLAAQPSPPPVAATGGTTASAGQEGARPRRWSADAWSLMRRGGGGALVSGALPATYGASQAGAVLRYRIAPRSRYRPTAYLRTTSTLGQLRETSAALGLAARPLPSLPVVAAVEARMTDHAGMRRFHPAVMAVTELPPFELPLAMRGEAYAQAGYVGGMFATPFADGQFRFDRSLYSLGAVDARLGGAVWGGVQKGAGRLDVGPSAAISMPLGRGTYGRVALDWRFRVAGNAKPGSGPAITLSAGF